MRAWALAALLLLAGAVQGQDVKIKNIDRKINLKTQIAKVTDVVEVAAGADVSELFFCYPQRQAERLSRIRVTVAKERVETTPVDVDAPDGLPDGAFCWSAAVSIKKGETATVDVAAAFTGIMYPNPAKVAQEEQQLMVYEDNLWVLSPYPIEQQTTTVVLPTAQVRGFGPADKGKHDGAKVVYEKIGVSAPWSDEPLKVHFHHDKSFKEVTKLVREIEVSHWGNVYVEESYVIKNAGAEHKGSFSRLKHAYHQGGRANSFQNVKAHLPPSAHSLYYKDLIGNISSSNTRKSFKETLVDINLRYPLMGGWKTDFVLGYSLPLAGFLFGRPKGRSRLIMDVSSPIDDVVVEELETRVVLPEGSANIKYTLPFDMDVSWDKKFTYLDTAGRPVLVLRKSNLTPQHNKPFAVDYTFGTAALLREPLLLVAVFAAFFLAVALYNRMEFTISKDDKWLEARARERAAATLTKLGRVWDAESEATWKLAAVAELLSDAGGAEAAGAARAAAEAKFKALEAAAGPLIEEVEAVSGKVAAAAREHAERGKALQQRALKLISDKIDAVRKGASAADAAKRTAPALRALHDGRAEWADATLAMCD